MAIYKRKRTLPGGKVRESSTYTIQFTDHAGSRRLIATGVKSLRTVQLIEEEIGHFVELRRINVAPQRERVDKLPPRIRARLADLGVVPRSASSPAAEPMPEILEAFRAHLRAKGCRPRSVDSAMSRVRRTVEAAGWRYAEDVDMASAVRAISRMKYRPGKPPSDPAREPVPARPIGGTTKRHYRACVHQFAAWLAQTHRLQENPLKRMTILADEGSSFGILSDAQFDELLRWLRAWKGNIDMPGSLWALCVEFARRTGVRATEQRALRPRDFHLDTLPHRFVIRSASSKNRGSDVVYLADPGLVESLRRRIEEIGPRDPVFPLPRETAKAMRRFLRESGVDIQWNEDGLPVDDDGLRIVWHSLRHMFITGVVNDPLTPLTTAVKLARHRQLSTTQRYCHVTEADKLAALQRQAGLRTA